MTATWFQRRAGWIVAVLSLLVLIALVLSAILFARLQDTRDDLARVEAGSALFASQVQGFQQQLVDLEPVVSDGLDQAIAGLETFGTSSLEFDVPIDEEVVIDTEIVIDRQITVPINETLPINETFDTTITVNTPLGELDLDVTVPVDVEVPVDLEIDIPVNERVPVSTSVPVQLSVPIRVDVAETELATLASSLAEGLRSFRDVIAGLGG